MRKIISIGIAVCAIAACSKNESVSNGSVDSAAGAAAPSSASSAGTMVRGSVAAASANQLVIQTDSGATDTVALAEPVQVFERESGSLSDVKPNSFVGVTSVKQADGQEHATEIHIFPEALRGLGEGSHMMSGAPTSGSRMTNGAVAGSQAPANGSAPSGGAANGASRMSNGSVASTNDSTIVVQYNGGSQTIVVPPNVTVTEIKATSKQPAVGDQVVVMTTKDTGGKLSAKSVMLMPSK